jgi:hypothetical protein
MLPAVEWAIPRRSLTAAPLNAGTQTTRLVHGFVLNFPGTESLSLVINSHAKQNCRMRVSLNHGLLKDPLTAEHGSLWMNTGPISD